MTEQLDGAVALVTGASSGIGAATARALAQRGATVALVARRKDRLDQLAGELEAQGGHALVVEADITDPAQASEAVDRTVATLGRLDTLVNNAGLMLLGPVVDAPLEEWERMLALNLNALLQCTHAALPHLMRAAQSPPRWVADIVNVSSVSGRIARSGTAVYSLTKFGLGAFSESLRQELATSHVRVSLVEPGVTETELRDHLRADIRGQVDVRYAGIERLEASDIADAIAYIVTRPRRVAINEILVRPTEQA